MISRKIGEKHMKNLLLSLLNEYLHIFPFERERQEKFLQYLQSHTDEEMADWNNFEGHVVAGGFVYAKKEKKFLCVYHKDLKMYLYPGGHIDFNDKTILETAEREVREETGLENLRQYQFLNNPLIPVDIDTHIISPNERLNLPEHYHFEFRYLFFVDNIIDITVDKEELENYKWVDIKELKQDKNYGKIVTKLKKFLEEE